MFAAGRTLAAGESAVYPLPVTAGLMLSRAEVAARSRGMGGPSDPALASRSGGAAIGDRRAPASGDGTPPRRTRTPSSRAGAGAAAGLVAGGLGAAAYALSCPELAFSFVAVGALIGPLLLRWSGDGPST